MVVQFKSPKQENTFIDWDSDRIQMYLVTKSIESSPNLVYEKKSFSLASLFAVNDQNKDLV